MKEYKKEAVTKEETILVEPKGESRERDPDLTMQIVTSPIKMITSVLTTNLEEGNESFRLQIIDYVNTGEVTDELKKSIYVILAKYDDITVGPYIIEYLPQILKELIKNASDRVADLLKKEQECRNSNMGLLTLKYSKCLAVTAEIRELATKVLCTVSERHNGIIVTIKNEALLETTLNNYLEKVGVGVDAARKRIRSLQK